MAKRPLNEGDCGLVMMFGGRGEAPEETASAVDMYNRMAMDNTQFGHNLVLDRLSKFDNSSRYSFDEEPELDAYVQTLFVDSLGDHGYDVNGDPYGDFKKMQGNLTGESPAPEPIEADLSSALAFMNSFGKVFAKR